MILSLVKPVIDKQILFHVPYLIHHHTTTNFHYPCKSLATLAQKRLKTKVNWEDILIVFTQTKSFSDATFALLTLEVEEACKHTYETNTRTVFVLKNDDSEIDGLLHPIRFIK